MSVIGCCSYIYWAIISRLKLSAILKLDDNRWRFCISCISIYGHVAILKIFWKHFTSYRIRKGLLYPSRFSDNFAVSIFKIHSYHRKSYSEEISIAIKWYETFYKRQFRFCCPTLHYTFSQNEYGPDIEFRRNGKNVSETDLDAISKGKELIWQF